MEGLYFVSRQEKKRSSLDLQIFDPKSNQEQDVLYISRKHLLSATYTKKLQGKRLPFYRFVQQFEIGLNPLPVPVPSIFKSQMNLTIEQEAKPKLGVGEGEGSFEAIEADPISYSILDDHMRDIRLFVDDKFRKNQVVEPVAKPNLVAGEGSSNSVPNFEAIEDFIVSYNILDDYMHNQLYDFHLSVDNQFKNFQVTEPKQELLEEFIQKKELVGKSSNELAIIDAVPISFKPPDNVYNDQLRKDQIIGHSSRNRGPNWLKNWNIHPRQRPNGRIDKYYYHKETNVMCRSLVEVDNYELYGIHPRQKRRKAEDETGSSSPIITSASKKGSLKRKSMSSSSQTCLNEEEDLVCLSPWTPKRKKMQQTVEKFLRESHENQLNNLVLISKAPRADCPIIVIDDDEEEEVVEVIKDDDDAQVNESTRIRKEIVDEIVEVIKDDDDSQVNESGGKGKEIAEEVVEVINKSDNAQLNESGRKGKEIAEEVVEVINESAADAQVKGRSVKGKEKVVEGGGGNDKEKFIQLEGEGLKMDEIFDLGERKEIREIADLNNQNLQSEPDDIVMLMDIPVDFGFDPFA